MKRLLAALLTLSMLVGIVPFSAFAESPGAVPETFAAAQESPGLDDETVQSIVSDPLLQGQYAPPQQTQPTVDTSNMSMEATDSFGKLLVNSIDEQNSASSSENRVIGVTVDGSTATVEYVAAEDADIVVALYTDDSEELMSASGTVDVFAMEENTGHSTVTVPLTGSIPASFIVKAFLLDKDEHAPLCNEFTSLAYTKDLSDLESSTIYDYPENQVVNLDEDVSNNFAVVTSDVTLITSDENIGTQNQITELDNDKLYYTIENASEEIQALQPGDILTYEYEPGYFLIARIEATGLWIFRMDKSFGEIKIPLDFATGHLSMTYHEWNWGECPHRLYKVTISLENCRSEGIAINQKNGDGSLTELGKTDESGTLVVYLKEGEYSLTATDVNKTYSKTFTVNQDAVDLAGHALTIELPLTSSVIVNPSNPIASGTCGTNLTWSLDGLGTLIISGTGSMTDFTSSYDDDTKENSVDSPWFEHRLDIQKIIINSGVTSIGNFAFAFCSNVTSVSVPDSVTRIGQGCFAQCANLTSIALPDDVTSIPMGSFTGCSSLVSISYSSKLESIGLMAFEDCVSLRSIDLPYGLTSIGYAAFMDCHSLTSITLPESLSGLGGFMGEVFANCTSLTSVTFPRSFTSTGFGTFGGCTSLVDVTIPDTITTIGASTFSDCTSLTNITLPSSITAIGEDAFSGCTSLTSFVIPNGVPSIGEDTFRNCYALTAITIPASVTTIGYAAFEYCYNLSSVHYAGTPAQWKQIDIDSGNTALEQAYEGNPISSCGDNATWSIDNAGTLTIRGTGEITDTPWSDPMILPYSVHIKNVVLEDGITGICSYAFDYTDIVSVTLPATLTHIDYSAFDGCSDLTTVNYAGSPEQWNNIKIANHNDELLNATRHYYSSNASTVSSEENSIFPSTATGNDHSFAASFSDLTPGVSYAVIVSRSEIDPLAPENLIYINQFRATSSGYQQSFQTPRSSALNADDMTYVIASGIYSFDEAPTPTPTPGGGSSSGGGGGGGGGAAVLIGVGAAAAITAGVIMMSPVEIKGRVVLADQAAVPGAKISLLREGKVVAQTTADENGSFSLKAKRGSYELTAAYTTADGQLIYKIIDIKAPAKDLTVTF